MIEIKIILTSLMSLSKSIFISFLLVTFFINNVKQQKEEVQSLFG
jgi:hypothetical protein